MDCEGIVRGSGWGFLGSVNCCRKGGLGMNVECKSTPGKESWFLWYHRI